MLFRSLKNFISTYKLDNVGFFTYSREENTKAYYMKGQVLNFVKKHRLKEIQRLQHNILIENQQSYVGKILNCVCEDKLEDNIYQFRSEYNSPNVDTVIYVKSDKPLTLNEFYNVSITGVINDDLEGEIYESAK